MYVDDESSTPCLPLNWAVGTGCHILRESVRRGDIQLLQMEVVDEDIGARNDNEEVALTHWRAPCAECSGKVRRGSRQLVCATCRCHLLFNCVTSTCLQADNLHWLVNRQCRFCNHRPYFEPDHPAAEPRFDKQYQGPKQVQLVIVKCQRYATCSDGARDSPGVAAGGRCMFPGNLTHAKGQNPCWCGKIYVAYDIYAMCVCCICSCV